MTRNMAREFAVRLAYELNFTALRPEELVAQRLDRSYFETLRDEDELYGKPPGAAQAAYIRGVVLGVAEHAPELDGYIARYARDWRFERIPLVAMYEAMYRDDVDVGVAINEAVEIAKKYETPETVRFINGILGGFARGELAPAT